jgi:hypothetical protein
VPDSSLDTTSITGIGFVCNALPPLLVNAAVSEVPSASAGRQPPRRGEAEGADPPCLGAHVTSDPSPTLASKPGLLADMQSITECMTVKAVLPKLDAQELND